MLTPTPRRICPRCERPLSDAAVVCHSCVKDLRRTLAAIADLWSNLQEAIAKQTAMGQRTEGKATKRDSQPLPVDLRASDVADLARTTITGWVRVLAEDNRLALPADTIPAMCAWLDTHRHALRRHDAAVEMCDEITYASGQIHRVVDYPDDRSRILVGPCITVDEDSEHCPGEIYAIIPERDGGTPRMECRACRNEWDSTQWTRMGVLIQRRKAQVEMQKTWRTA